MDVNRLNRNIACERAYAWAAVILMVIGWLGRADHASAAERPALIGLDHIPVVVADLKTAGEAYQHLGFSLKPGRLHENGLQNKHVKFKDGSGIELVSVPAIATDTVTGAYSEALRRGEGPVFLSFHARNTDALVAALTTAGIAFANEGGLITLRDPELDFVFFVKDNRSPTDLPAHFAHANGAVAMTEVWLALEGRAFERMRALLRSLGAIERADTVEAPKKMLAQVFQIQNGRVVVVPKSQQRIAGREIVGATFCVLDKQPQHGRARHRGKMIKPSAAHGLWLRFVKRPDC